MFSSFEYLMGWAFYLGASLGLIVVWWFMTRWISIQVIRNTLRVVVAAALLMPYPVDSESAFLAPAIIMTFIEGLFIRDEGFSRAGIPLVIAICSAGILYVLLSLIWSKYREKRKGASQPFESQKNHNQNADSEIGGQ